MTLTHYLKCCANPAFGPTLRRLHAVFRVPLWALERNDWGASTRPSIYVAPRSFRNRYIPPSRWRRYARFDRLGARLAAVYHFSH